MPDRNVRGNHWVVPIRGAPVAMDQWRGALKSPFDPWIEIMKLGNDNPRHVIRSIEFGGATTAEAVRERALFMIEALNGTMNSLGATDRVEFDGVLEVQPDGKLHHTLFPETAILSADRFHMPIIAGGTPGTPAPSPAQRWYKLGTADRVVADMLVHFGKEANWYELYKTYEGVRRLCGDEDKLLKKSWHRRSPTSSFSPAQRTTSIDMLTTR
jgi:hypothetical protein